HAGEFRADRDARKRVLGPLPMGMKETESRGTGASAMGGSPMAPVAGSPTRRLADTSSETLAQIPISMLADIGYKTGPPSIRNENCHLSGFVFVVLTSEDIHGYEDESSTRLNDV